MSKALRLTAEAYVKLVLSPPVRRRLALEEGDRLMPSVEEDGSLRLESAREVAKRARRVLKDLRPDSTPSDRSRAEELIDHRGLRPRVSEWVPNAFALLAYLTDKSGAEVVEEA